MKKLGRNEIRTHEKIVFKTIPLDRSGTRNLFLVGNGNRTHITGSTDQCFAIKLYPIDPIGIEPISLLYQSNALPLSYG